jgi:hypothetical protein
MSEENTLRVIGSAKSVAKHFAQILHISSAVRIRGAFVHTIALMPIGQRTRREPREPMVIYIWGKYVNID